jgi:hypothetical protein
MARCPMFDLIGLAKRLEDDATEVFKKFRLHLGGPEDEATEFLNCLRTMVKSLENEATEEFLKLLLDLMKLYYQIPRNKPYIRDFTGSYRFKDKDGKVNVLVKFHDGKMEISEDPLPEPNVMVTFKDSNALRRFLLACKKDILNVILNNEIQVTGNLNYLYKFGFMANHPIHQVLNLANK